MNHRSNNKLQTLGWREWIALPELGIEKIKVKVDTGAKTSTLHAFRIKPFKKNGKHQVRFTVHPLQRRMDVTIQCVADILDIRWVTDSGGHRERRYVIETLIAVGNETWRAEITLTNRDTMRFRMLLGRTAIKSRFQVNPAMSYVTKTNLF